MRRILSFRILFLFSFVFWNLSLNASGVLSISKRLGTFSSGWTQSYVMSQSYDTTGIAPNNISVLNSSFVFICPGASFLTGMETKYENGYRRFRFACSFFENSQGQLVSKTLTNCNTNGWDNKLADLGKSTCTTNQFIAGMNAAYNVSAKINTAAQPDQQFKSICCSVESPDQSSVVSTTCGPTKTLNPPQGSSNGMQHCGLNMAMQMINTQFQVIGTKSDRIFTYKCCNLKN